MNTCYWPEGDARLCPPFLLTNENARRYAVAMTEVGGLAMVSSTNVCMSLATVDCRVLRVTMTVDYADEAGSFEDGFTRPLEWDVWVEVVEGVNCLYGEC